MWLAMAGLKSLTVAIIGLFWNEWLEIKQILISIRVHASVLGDFNK